jgi:hypothetical protein
MKVLMLCNAHAQMQAKHLGYYIREAHKPGEQAHELGCLHFDMRIFMCLLALHNF